MLEQDTKSIERKNFPYEIVEKVYILQGKCCAKCGLPLSYGYDVHHKDGDNSNINEDNCQLLHPRCHQAEMWKTLKDQKEKALGQAMDLLSASVEGKLAGALVKECNELLDKVLSIQNQLYGIEHFDLPAKERVEYSEAAARANLESYSQGYIDGLRAIPDVLAGKKVTPLAKT